MAIGKLRKFHTTDQTLNQIQDATIAVLNPVLSNLLLSGNLVKAVQLSNKKDNIVSHGLGRNYISYIECAKYNSVGFVNIWVSDKINNSPEKYVILNCMDSITLDFYFF